MATSEELEIYKQRYDTYRHLDRLRWQMFQISVGSGSLILAFGKEGSSGPAWWVLAIVGFLLMTFAAVMERIRQGISKNSSILRRVAAQIGDTEIPPATSWRKSVSFWIAFTLFIFGLLCIVFAILSYR